MRKTILVLFASLLAVAALANADDVEKFGGKVKVDRDRLHAMKKVAIIQMSGVVKVGNEPKELTEIAATALVEQLKAHGYEVVTGQQVVDAFAQVVTSANPQKLRQELIEKGGKSPEEADYIAGHWAEFLEAKEELKNMLTSKTYYVPGSVDLYLPDLDPKIDPKKPRIQKPTEKEVHERVMKLAEALGVDACITAEFGFGAFQYHDPTFQQAQRSNGRETAGLLPALNEMRALKKGEQATANVGFNVYERDGKNICEAVGSVATKEGAGFTFSRKKVTEDLMPVAAQGLPRAMFERLEK